MSESFTMHSVLVICDKDIYSSCSHVCEHGCPNEMIWDGVSTNLLVVGTLEEQRAFIACSHCKLSPYMPYQNIVYGAQ